jgi:hypothetical protein
MFDMIDIENLLLDYWKTEGLFDLTEKVMDS